VIGMQLDFVRPDLKRILRVLPILRRGVLDWLFPPAVVINYVVAAAIGEVAKTEAVVVPFVLVRLPRNGIENPGIVRTLRVRLEISRSMAMHSNQNLVTVIE